MSIVFTVHTKKPAAAESLSRAAGVRQITAQLLLNRGVTSGKQARIFFDPTLENLEDPFRFPDMEKAIARLRLAIKRREPILVFGDSDVDGLTSSTILYEVLENLGGCVRVRLSNRIQDGYGLPASAIAEAGKTRVKLVVLVDCGTNQPDEIKALKRLGIETIIVDHHVVTLGAKDAVALVNPHSVKDSPGRELCSAGLAFKVAQALLGKESRDLMAYLDLAALGTLADYMPLVKDSRILVQHGLPRITNTLRPGLARLCADTRTIRPQPEQVLRRLVPRINAFGRLGDPTTAWHLLREQDDSRIEEWLAEAETVHGMTKQLQRRIIFEAEQQISRMHFKDQFVLVVSRSGWHQGLMGPLASQLSARYGRPAIAVALNGAQGVGSARSVPQLNLLKTLQFCEKDLLRFGGHAQACGLTIEREKLDAFSIKVNEHAKRLIGVEGLTKHKMVDVELRLKEIEASWVTEVKRLAPFGPGNPRPTVLLRGVTIKKRSSRTGWIQEGNRQMPAKGALSLVVSGGRYDVAVSPSVETDGSVTLSLAAAKASRESS